MIKEGREEIGKEMSQGRTGTGGIKGGRKREEKEQNDGL